MIIHDDENMKSSRRRPLANCGLVLLLLMAQSACAARAVSKAEVVETLRRATQFFWQEVSSHGGYVWRYSGDLELREAEGIAGPDTIWVQPPGTPAVGDAFLDAYETTGETLHLDAARAAANALLLGQLHSGGWYYRIEFDPQRRTQFDYRYNLEGQETRSPVPTAERNMAPGWYLWRQRRYKGNMTILDDDTSQAALRFLMRVDQQLGFEDERIHEAVRYGLASLLNAQYPNGAWSHNYDRYPARPPQADRYPVTKASYPQRWPRTWPKKFAGCYMLNDAITQKAIVTMLRAWRVYDDERFRRSALRGGGFLRLAQMPAPQPAWAQQYDPNMHPVWDRPFEPAAISGRESQTVLETLLLLYEETGETRFLEPVPRTLDYLRSSLLSDGRLARFYELETNRPIYFTRNAQGGHQPTYNRQGLAKNYQFVVDSRLDEIEAAYRRLKTGAPLGARAAETQPLGHSSKPTQDQMADVVDGMDRRGAWVEKGHLTEHKIEPASGVIDCQTFIANMKTLCQFLHACEVGVKQEK